MNLKAISEIPLKVMNAISSGFYLTDFQSLASRADEIPVIYVNTTTNNGNINSTTKHVDV